MISIVIFTFILAFVALPLCSVAFVRYVSRLVPVDTAAARWWLCLGISVTFAGTLFSSAVRIWYFLQGGWYDSLESFNVEWVLVGQSAQISAILASLCHLRAAVTCSSSPLTRRDYSVAAVLVSLILSVILLLT